MYGCSGRTRCRYLNSDDVCVYSPLPSTTNTLQVVPLGCRNNQPQYVDKYVPPVDATTRTLAECNAMAVSLQQPFFGLSLPSLFHTGEHFSPSSFDIHSNV